MKKEFMYCPVFVDGAECGNRLATKQTGKFKPDSITIKCDKCGKYIRYDYVKNEFYIAKTYYPQDSSGKRIY